MGENREVVYDEKFGIDIIKREICAALGEEFWNKLVNGILVPDIEKEKNCECCNMYVFMKRLEEAVDSETLKNILYRVRHGLHPTQFKWARDKFLETSGLDEFLKKHTEDELNNYIELNRREKDFYGQGITDEVLEFIRQNPAMLAPVREGNILRCMAIPFDAKAYLAADDDRQKRYHACHCPFAKESILSDSVVSPMLCNCSLGHMMNFVEAFLGRPIPGRGKVVRSVLKGDLNCEYEIAIPDDIMKTYVEKKEADIIISNYYRYYHMFTKSGIVDFHMGPVNWIMPKEGENGPAIAYNIKLDEKTATENIQALIEGIREKKVPQRWLITQDAVPSNIITILEENGFRNLADDASEPEPGMLLHKNDFQPYVPEDSTVICRKIQSKEDFQTWIRIVNTALHGWDMIDVEHYYIWVEEGYLNFYLGEIDGIPVATAATIQTGDLASLEFVSTLEEYRRRKAASAVCSMALTELFERGASSVTLSACGESVSLYRKFGFRSYFNNIVMQYDI